MTSERSAKIFRMRANIRCAAVRASYFLFRAGFVSGGGTSGGGANKQVGAVGGADAAANPRGICRSGTHSRTRQTPSPSDRSRPAAVSHFVRAAGDRQNDAGPCHRGNDPWKVRAAERRGKQRGGDAQSRGRGSESSPNFRQENDPVRRRDPSLQQGAAGHLVAGR